MSSSIYKEQEANGNQSRVMIPIGSSQESSSLCPALVRLVWQGELRERGEGLRRW